MITKSSIENLKNNLDVVGIISQFLQVKKSGANFKACCPFHGEKTPSFVISPSKQIYHCFGCGVGGDSIKFVMEFEKLSYPEALEKLSSMVNFTLEYDNNNQNYDYKVIEKLNDYYEKLLIQKKDAYDYLIQRGISSFSIEKFELGYAPSSNDTLNYLKQNFLNLGDAQEFGLIDQGQNGLYARFIDRITFPIYTINAKLVGFGGRTIIGHNAKYINSPQTKFFNKSRLLYGYNLAKQNIFKKNEIIITEGYLDVIMLHQAGFDNAVASLGTALTNEHLPLLSRGEPKIILAYDGDKAGLNAAFKASKILSQNGFDGGVVIFDGGLDPADMVKDGKLKELNDMFLKTKPFIEFVIDFTISTFDITNPNEKQKALIQINEYLQSLNGIMQEEYKPYIASALNINSNLVRAKIPTINANRMQVNLTNIDIAELSIVKTLLENKDMHRLLKDVDIEVFQTHKEELNIVLENENTDMLRGLLLQEELKIYNENELKNQLLVLLKPYYTKLLQHTTNDKTTDFKIKSRKIRDIKEKIVELRKGKI
jgi:DNA primase